MSYAVISYPHIPDDDSAYWMATLQSRYDMLTPPPVPPHFTFVFPTDNVDAEPLAAHVKAVTQQHDAIPFRIRGAMMMPDYDVAGRYYVFLVPDEGMADMIRLHAGLYSGPLAGELRVSAPFIPHITVGYTDNRETAMNITNVLNSETFDIFGWVNCLNVLDLKTDPPQTFKWASL